MRKIVGLTLALVFALSMAAGAEEIQGKIQKVDPADRMVTLEDGTQVWLAEGLSMENLKEGATVKANYEERDGKKVITTFEVSE